MPDVIDEVVEKIVRSGRTLPSQIVGCSESEIEELELRFGLRLPVVYRSFLRKMGKGAHGFIPGMDAFLPELLDNRSALEDVLQLQSEHFMLQPSHLVITNLQGYAFEFIDTVDDPIDPPVHGFSEGYGMSLRYPSLSDFYRRHAEIALYLKGLG